MSYQEENGQVILTMSREDYVELDSSIKLVQLFEEKLDIPPIQRKAAYLRARLNSGNPNYMPYQVEEKKS